MSFEFIIMYERIPIQQTHHIQIPRVALNQKMGSKPSTEFFVNERSSVTRPQFGSTAICELS